MHFNVTAHPTAPWVWRQLLEATPWGQQPRYLIRDRDRSYGGAFIYKARAIGIKTVLTAVRAPKANAIAERVVGTLRRECLDHLIIVNERLGLERNRCWLELTAAAYNLVRMARLETAPAEAQCALRPARERSKATQRHGPESDHDEEGGHADTGQPGADRVGRELRAVIGAQRDGRPALDEELGEAGQHVIRPQAAGDDDGEFVLASRPCPSSDPSQPRSTVSTPPSSGRARSAPPLQLSKASTADALLTGRVRVSKMSGAPG